MSTEAYLVLVLGMGLVTYLPRAAPLLVLSKLRPPRWLLDWLEMIPAAVLSALVLPELVVHGDPMRLAPLSPELLVGIPTFAFALKTRSLGGTVVLGMGLYWAAERLL
jgi:branched-subunit amino acid transport protein